VREALTVRVCAAQGTRIVRVGGTLDRATAPKLAQVLADLDGTASVFVELWDVSCIDSSGLRVLVDAHRHLEHRGRMLVLGGIPPAGLREMKVLGLDKVLHLDPAM
jgi:stage II sporulation protein AA (anti-sigma F factor antagonist)